MATAGAILSDDDRATQIFIEGVGSSSGYAVTANYILTARHVLHQESETDPVEDTAVDFRLWGDLRAGERSWRHAHVLWSDPAYDVALLEIDDAEIERSPTLKELGNTSKPLTIGRMPVAGEFESVTFGWPRVFKRGDERHPMPFRGKTTGRGRSVSAIIRAIATDLTPKEEIGWKGMSGAALRIQGTVVGIIVQADDRFKEGVLEAVPLAAIAENARLWEYLGRLPVGDLATHAPNIPVPTEQVPITYVDRPELIQQVMTALISEEKAPSGRVAISAVYGLGGIGKTTLAASIAWDPSTATRFPDGRLWLTLGQEPREPITILIDWLTKLGYSDLKPRSYEDARADLVRVLQDRAILFVIDDIWPSSASIAEILMVPAPRCRYLLTTRFAEIATDLHAQLFEVDAMSPDQATTLLERNLGRTLVLSERPMASKLAEAVGYHPQALELAASRVAKGKSWEDLVAALTAEMSRLEALEDPPSILRVSIDLNDIARRRRSVRASLNLSIRALTDSAQYYFAWLGVLHEETAISDRIAATLWSIEPTESNDVLGQLADMSLLKRDASGVYRMHDLVNDLARSMISAPVKPASLSVLPGLGLDLREASRKLLDRYRARARDGHWETLTDDGYIYDRLVYHLSLANDVDGLSTLLLEGNGRNGWADARLKQAHTYSGYLDDLEVAWQSVGAASWRFGSQIRWLLALSSINSLVTNVEPAVLPHLVRRGTWTPAAAFRHAAAIHDDYARQKAFARIAPVLPQKSLREMLDSIQKIKRESSRDSALEEVFPFLSDELKEMALDVTKIEDFWLSIRLKKLASYLTTNQRNKILHILSTTKKEQTRADVIIALAPCFSDSQAATALTLIEQFGEDWWRGICIAGVIPHLPSSLKTRAVEIIKGLSGEFIASYAIRTAVPVLSRPLRSQLLNVVRHVRTPWIRQETLRFFVDIVQLSPIERIIASTPLSESDRKLIISRALGDRDDDEGSQDSNHEDRALKLAGLGRLLPGVLQEDIGRVVIAEVEAIKENLTLQSALKFAAEELPDGLKHHLIAVASQISDAQVRFEALIALFPNMPPELKPSTAREALDAVKRINFEQQRASALEQLVTYLPQELRIEAITVARAVRNHKARSVALAAVLDYMPVAEQGNAFTELLETMWSAGDDRERGWGLRDLVANLGSTALETFDALLRAVCSIHDESNRWYLLSCLAERLGPFLSAVMVSDLLAVAAEFQDSNYLAWTFGSLAEHVAEPLKPSILAAAFKISVVSTRVSALESIVGHVSGDLAQSASEAILQNIKEITAVTHRLSLLTKLIRIRPDAVRPAILSLVDEITDARVRTQTFLDLSQKFPEFIQDALRESVAISEPAERANCLRQIAIISPSSAQSLLGNIFETIETYANPWDKSRAFGALVALISTPDLRDRALRIAISIGDPSARASALKELIRCFQGPARIAAITALLDAARVASSEWESVYALEGLKLSDFGEQAKPALALIRGVKDHGPRSYGLINMMIDSKPDRKIALGREVLENLRQLYQRGAFQSHMWATLADHLPESLRREALDVALGIPDESTRADALTQFVACLSADLASTIVEPARVMKDGANRLKTLSSLVGRLPKRESDLLLREVLMQSDDESIKQWGWDHAFRPLSSRWQQIDLSGLGDRGEILLKIIAGLKYRKRGDLFQDLGHLAPIIYQIGGIEAIRDTLRGVADVSKWWQ